jgi:hypothetical protein
MKVNIPSHLSDAALVAEVKSLARCERQAIAQLIAYLAEFDDRRLYRGAGFSSLFTYCFLNLTTVRILASHVTADNQHELFAAASGKSRHQVEELVARYDPRPDVPSSVRRLPPPRPIPEPPRAPATISATGTPLSGVTLPPPTVATASVPAPGRRPLVSPVAPDRYEIRFTASAGTCEKLRLAQDILRHAVTTADPAEIIDRALTVLLDQLARKRFAATERPRVSHGTAPGSRDIAAKVRRTVWLRDGGRCAFTAKGGHRCNERAFVEFHHLDPHGFGGEATVENLELRCRAHNLYEAELFYGRRNPGERSTRSGTS